MRRGIACICLSAFGFALMAMFVRLADDLGSPLPAIEKAFFRNLVACTIAFGAFAQARRKGVASRLPRGAREWSDLILRVAFGTAGIFANFYAVSHIPVGDAMALNKTAPFFTLVLCWPLLGERMRLRQALCVLGAMAGAMLVVRPGFAELTVDAAIGLFSGFCAGMAYAFLHRLGRRGVSSSFIILFFSTFSCLASVPFMLVAGVPMNGAQLLALFGAGAGAAIGQFGITWAYRFAEPRQIAVFDYTGIIFAALLGFVVFGQVPDWLSVVGFAMIIAMAAVLTCGSRGARSLPKQSATNKTNS